MALHAYTLKLVRQALTEREKDFACFRRAAMFSCHDIIASVEDVTRILGDRVRGLPFREDSKQILNWHRAHDVAPGVFDTWDVFKALGWNLDCFDLYRARGREICRDLNEPLPDEVVSARYDFVYDNILGQVYMCGQSMRSAMEITALNGYLLSVSMANGPNHGFYSISPTFYHDVFRANEFEVVHHTVVTDIARTAQEHPFSPTTGCVLPYGAINVVLAKRTAVAPFRYPTQSKFEKSPDSKVA